MSAVGKTILTLRVLLQNNRFESGWALLLETYRAEVSVPDNVVPLRSPRIHQKSISFGGTPYPSRSGWGSHSAGLFPDWMISASL